MHRELKAREEEGEGNGLELRPWDDGKEVLEVFREIFP